MTEWSPGKWKAGLTNPEAQNAAPHTWETGWSACLDSEKQDRGGVEGQTGGILYEGVLIWD